MEDFAEYLLDEARSAGASLHQFLIQYTEADEAFHLFFEGDEDPSFYMPYVRRRKPAHEVHVYICSGKPSIKAIREHLKKNGYSFAKLNFFVDRDLDDFLNCQIEVDESVYITDYYSIENHLVGSSQAEVLLVDLAGCRQTDAECRGFLERIELLLERYADVMAPFMAAALAARANGISTNFNNLNLARIVEVGGDTSTVRRAHHSYRTFKSSVFPVGAAVRFQDVLRWRRELKRHDERLWFRGKYQLWFFEKLLFVHLSAYIAKQKAAKQRAPRLPACLRDGRLLEALGGRLPEVPSLAAFLDLRLR